MLSLFFNNIAQRESDRDFIFPFQHLIMHALGIREFLCVCVRYGFSVSIEQDLLNFGCFPMFDKHNFSSSYF